jgi:hypothetical protein
VLPDYWVERPPITSSPATEAAIDAVLSALNEAADGPLDIDELLGRDEDVEPWTFLYGLAERRRFAFHGTGDGAIASFEPRQPIDFAPFGDQKAVFATSDPVWAMFYAIVDRDRYEITLNNGCILLLDPPGPPHYFFSISHQELAKQPWRRGYVYLLPADTFVEQEGGEYAGYQARIPQLASPVPVTPLARIQIAPDDFPFLGQIRGHEDGRLSEYAQAVMTAAAWPE